MRNLTIVKGNSRSRIISRRARIAISTKDLDKFAKESGFVKVDVNTGILKDSVQLKSWGRTSPSVAVYPHARKIPDVKGFRRVRKEPITVRISTSTRNIIDLDQKNIADAELKEQIDELFSRDNKLLEVALKRSIRGLASGISKMSQDQLSEIAGSSSDTGSLSEALAKAIISDPSQSIEAKSKILGSIAKKQMIESRGGTYSTEEVMEYLTITKNTVKDKRTRLEILGIKVNKGFKYPAWQFESDTVISGLKDVLVVLTDQKHSDWSKIRFFSSDNRYLEVNLPEYPCPIDALKAGKLEEVISAANVYMKPGAN
ncbi:hypothetical protein [Marinicella sp. W31]|uniref:hypothetical protein n=1 Tax=Marinicella sp. W31 TaxID=3023713 RepID=UPI003757EE74